MAWNVEDLVSLFWRPLDIMSNFNIFVNLKLHVCLLGINAHLIFHTYKNETAFYLLENLCQMFQMRNSTIIGFKNMVSKIHGYCILCNQKMFCHLCWSTNNFQVGHWRNLCLTLPTKQKKKNTNTQSTLVNSSGYFQYEISFHKVSINQTLLHFCEKRIEHFGNHTSSLTFDKLSSEVNLFDIPNDRKIGAKIEKRKKKWNYLPIM